MAGFDGRISFEGDQSQAKALLGLGMKLAAKQHASKGLLRLDSSVKGYDLGGGAYCIIADLSNMRSMHIVAPVFPETIYVIPEAPIQPGVVGPGVYDVISGFTHDAEIVTQEIIDSKGKKKKIKVINHYKPTLRTSKRHKDLLIRQRLAVQENPIFTPIDDDGTKIYSEHAHVKPSNYTGMMARVVQVLMGIGIVVRPTLEEMLHFPPLPPVGSNLYTKKAQAMVSGFGLYGHEAAFTPRIDFDYRVWKTHGITFDLDGIAWVIEIGTRGVHAMRLYMDPLSTTWEGLKRWVQVNPELEDFLLTLRGMPLGLTLPTFDLFDKFKRAGEVIELISAADMQVFYGKSPMSTDTSWCFSDYGTEAHNTCWQWGDDFVKEGFHYCVGTRLQYERFKPWTPKRSELAAKFHTVYEVNKCRRMDEEHAKQILAQYAVSTDAGYQAFDTYVVTPTLVGTSSISLQKMGKLYHPAKFDFQPQIKFPEGTLGAILSFDFSDAGDSPDSVRRTLHHVKCDTPMYVCYTQGVLDIINYTFDNTQEYPVEPADTATSRTYCQYIGKWTEVSWDEGPMAMYGHFYSSQMDFREERRLGHLTVSKFNGTKVGAYPGAGSEFLFSSVYHAWTMVMYYTNIEQTYMAVAPYLDLSVAIPLSDRSAYYMAVMDTLESSEVTYKGRADVYRAAQVDEWEVYHFLFAWVGSTHCPKPWIDPSNEICFARKRCVTVDPDNCFDDNLHQGFYINACPPPPGPDAPFDMVKWAPLKPPSDYTYVEELADGEVDSDVYFVNDTPYGVMLVKTLTETYTHGSSLNSFWWMASPTEGGSLASIKAVHSCEGAPITNLMDEIDGVLTHIGGPEYMQDSWIACYTGVIE